MSAAGHCGPGPVGTDEVPLAELRGVRKDFGGSSLLGSRVTIQAVSGVDLIIPTGQTVGVVGESGCGKSTLGRLLVGLEEPNAGDILVRGTRLAQMSRRERRSARYQIQMMFQDPFAALNPRMSLRAIIDEPLRARGGTTRTERRQRVCELAEEVGLATNQLGRYPSELSGGQRQRVGLARAIATRPALVVADEPVSALDVSVRSQILNLMLALQREYNLSYMMISHDLAVVRWISDMIAVMYLGKIVEVGSPREIFGHAAHHYTRALLDAVPEPNPTRPHRLTTVRGELPSAANPPSGCRFRTRCPAAQERCAAEEPPLRALAGKHLVACHYPLDTHSTQERSDVFHA